MMRFLASLGMTEAKKWEQLRRGLMVSANHIVTLCRAKL